MAGVNGCGRILAAKTGVTGVMPTSFEPEDSLLFVWIAFYIQALGLQSRIEAWEAWFAWFMRTFVWK